MTTNALAKAKPITVPDSTVLPQPSTRLANVMHVLNDLYRDGPTSQDHDCFSERVPKPELVAEAKQLLQEFDKMAQPPTLELVSAWLRPLATAVRNPPSRSDFEARAAALFLTSDDLTTAAFTRETLRAAMGQFSFWPSVAEIRAILVEDGQRYLKPRRDLLKVVSVRRLSELDEAWRLYREKRAAEPFGLYPSQLPAPVRLQISGGF